MVYDVSYNFDTNDHLRQHSVIYSTVVVVGGGVYNQQISSENFVSYSFYTLSKSYYLLFLLA